MPVRRPTLPKPYDPLGLFGDGPPKWTINKDKPGERPSTSASEAARQRDARAFKLRWHAKRGALLAGNPTATSFAASALADKLDACAPPQRPCLSGACPVCVRAQQRWLVRDTMRVLRPLVLRGYRPQVLSLVPEFGRIPAGSLNKFDSDKFLDDIREALNSCGIVHFKLGLDVSLNERAGVASPGFWQLQLWGFFHKPKRGWRVQTQSSAQSERWSDPARQGRASRLLGSCRRVWCEGHFRASRVLREDQPGSRGSGECWNTRGRHLRGDPWVELMLFLDRIGLQRRLLLSARSLSVPPLHSQSDPRLRGSK